MKENGGVKLTFHAKDTSKRDMEAALLAAFASVRKAPCPLPEKKEAAPGTDFKVKRAQRWLKRTRYPLNHKNRPNPGYFSPTPNFFFFFH